MCYKTINKENFIQNAIKIHNNQYDYSMVDYKNNKTKIDIICKVHGIFKQTPNAHLNGNKCNKCSSRYKKTTNEFISECREVHKYKPYDYSLVNYVNNKQKIDIICTKHNYTFTLYARSHLNGVGCNKCKIDNFVEKFRIIHSDYYDYSKSEYNGAFSEIKIICPIHGEFYQNPYYHLDGCGCKKCNMFMSKGVRFIKDYLDYNNINYELEYKFKDCKYKRCLPFDFYIKDFNICIEFDGQQHFKSVEFYGGDLEFNKILIKDNIKNLYCLNNNIKLIRISYIDNIKIILDGELKNGF